MQLEAEILVYKEKALGGLVVLDPFDEELGPVLEGGLQGLPQIVVEGLPRRRHVDQSPEYISYHIFEPPKPLFIYYG